MKNYWSSLLITAICIFVGWQVGGWEGAFIVAILGILEISLSFDNAIYNAIILKNMTPFWQKMFLYVGIFVAVFGMRLILPILIVSVTSGIGMLDTVNLVIDDGAAYSKHLEAASTSITAFGGMFLFMIFLDFLFNPEKEHHWLGGVERFFGGLGQHGSMSTVVALATLIVSSLFVEEEETLQFLFAGVLGVAIFFAMGLLKNIFEEEETGDAVVTLVKRGGFMSFCHLELVDASFSLDGVIGAFAMSTSPVIIGLGLTIGAWTVRTITLHLVFTGALAKYVYLESGANFAIGVLAIIMLSHPFVHVPEIFTGLSGATLILLAVYSSIRYRKNSGKLDESPTAV